MVEETSKIRQHIDFEREQLGRNFDEIEDRVKEATDLKAHFDKNTGLILGAALAGGFLLSLALRKSGPAYGAESRAAETRLPVSKHLQQVAETVDNVFEGLIGVAAEKLRSFVEDAVPGFQTQYDAITRRGGRSPIHQIKPNPTPGSDYSAVR